VGAQAIVPLQAFLGAMVQRWQMALVLTCFVATYFVVRVIQGDPLTRTQGPVAWGVAFLVGLVALASLAFAGRQRRQ